MDKKEVQSLDWKAKKILCELDNDARQSYADIAKKTGFSKQSVVYRINNLLDTGLIKQFISFIDTQRLGYTFYDVFFKLKQYTKTEENRIIREIKKLSEVGWFISTRGEWKLVVCMMAKNPADFNESLEKIINILGDKIIRHEFFIVLDAQQLPYKKLLDAPKENYHKQTYLGKNNEVNLKRSDYNILSELSKNARIPQNELVEKTGLTLEKVRYSIKKLEKSGLIQAYKPLINIFKAGYSWHLMLIQFNFTEDKTKFISYLKSLPEVFYIVKGVGNWGLMVEFHTETLEEFGNVHDNILAKFEGLIANESIVQVTDEHKCLFYPGA